MKAEDFAGLMPGFRGRFQIDAPLAPLTWFRVGGAADVLASPADEDDLAYLLANLPLEIPVTVVGVGSNLIVRDGGVRGVVIRLGGRFFGTVKAQEGAQILAGAASLDASVARAAAEAGIDGFAFLRGVPGTVGGALRMNAGAHNGEIKDVLTTAYGLDRRGCLLSFDNTEMGFFYRGCGVPSQVIFTRALFQGRRGVREQIEAEMARISNARAATQPIGERTGGSTFKNPPERKAWQLIDAAGCRGLRVGDAEVSTLHCNFLLNKGAASAKDIESLGEEVRRRVRESSGVELEWEIKRIGTPISA